MGFADDDVMKTDSEFLHQLVYMDASGYAVEESAFFGEYSDRFCLLWLRNPPMKIAGYDDYSLYFYFAEEEKNTELITVRILFRSESETKQQIFDDLKTKLNTVYGENQTKKTETRSKYMRLGQDNTAIHLGQGNYSVGISDICLDYGKTDAYAGEPETEKPAVDASDVSGL